MKKTIKNKLSETVLISGLLSLLLLALSLAGMAQSSAGKVDSPAVLYKTVKINGLVIFYREAGDPRKPAILLLHGFPTSSFMFRNLIPGLANNYHVVAPDYPGFGQSSMPKIGEFNYTFDNLSNVVEKFTEQIGLANYAIYVQDYGAPIGYRLATRNPNKITGLIVQNGNAYENGLSEFAAPLKSYGESDGKDEKLTETLRGLMKLEGTKFQYLHGAKNPLAISPDAWTLDQALLDREGNIEIQLALFKDYLSNIKQYDRWHEYFRKFQPPTLIVWGKNDPFFTVNGVENGYRKDLKNIEVHYFETGHFALEENAPEITAFINSFLAKNVKK